MLDRQKGEVVFECDECGDTLETGTGNWDSALNMLRRESWKAKKYGQDWVHVCPRCQKLEH